jgi:hypothetical protein
MISITVNPNKPARIIAGITRIPADPKRRIPKATELTMTATVVKVEGPSLKSSQHCAEVR